MFGLGKNKNTGKHLNSDASMLLSDKTPFAVTEAYKTLRTNTIFTLAAIDHDLPHRNIFEISSAVPGEGKSITSANLAYSFAQTGSHVLLVDADMRKPVQHKIFELDNDRGLSTILLSLENLPSMMHKDVRPGLDIITSGPIPPNPSELLGSQAMNQFLDVISRVYDYVIIDTPPITIVTDALTFSFNSAGILLAVCPEVCRHGDLKRVLDAIELSNTHILGTVLSNTYASTSGYGYRKKYGSYYKYKYGYYYNYTTSLDSAYAEVPEQNGKSGKGNKTEKDSKTYKK